MDNQKHDVVIKLTRDEAYQIEYAAKARGMNCLDYIVESALHRERLLTPAILGQMENILQKAWKAIKNQKVKKKVRKEMMELWAYLMSEDVDEWGEV